jgi:hypothetical protein
MGHIAMITTHLLQALMGLSGQRRGKRKFMRDGHAMIQRQTLRRGRAARTGSGTCRGGAGGTVAGRDGRRGSSASVTGAVLFGGMSGSTGTNVNSDNVLGDTWTWNGAASTWKQACTNCTVTPPPALGAAIAYHRADVEDLLFGGYGNAGSPAAPRTTWIWTSKWAAA